MCYETNDNQQQTQTVTANPYNYIDTPDMTNQYNTQLSPADESKYEKWRQQQSNVVNRDLSKDENDYDLRGFWQEHPNFSYADKKQHLNDTYKKPNHPTFSKESKYSGTDGYTGGEWVEGKNGDWSYVASPTNLKMRSEIQMQDYFKRVEPDVKLDTSKAKEDKNGS